jgi:hypothetical protein
MLNRKEAELAAEVLKTRSLTERIELAAAAISWDSPWIPGEHAYTQVKERIDRALAILNATESPEAIAAPDPSPDPDDLQSTPDFTNEDLSPASTPKDPETPTLYQSHPDNTDFAGGVHEPLRSGPLTPTSPPGSTVQVVLSLEKGDFEEIKNLSDAEGKAVSEYLRDAISIRRYLKARAAIGARFYLEEYGQRREIVFTQPRTRRL